MRDPDLYELAGRVVRYLPGYALDNEWDAFGVMLDGPEASRLHMTESDGRLTVSGCWPRTDLRVKPATVSVKADRLPAAIALEVRKRLLPGYLARLAEVVEHEAEVTRADAERARVMERIGSMFPGSHVRGFGHRNGRSDVIFRPPGLDRSCSAEAYGDGSSLKIEINGITPDLAVAMLDVLRQENEREGNDGNRASRLP